ncbi:sulfotransferase family protein [Solicola sp. PLA-1-18]|uniref:sulfotransferase family protein n=1 Tax=Solicola sp. PLA-1-18 TaxID=3380532 RepID=UPI003B7E05F6
MSSPSLPDFLVVGAPKAGTSALHAALARHPEVHLTSPSAPYLKEPKYFLCDDAPPPAYRGPGDAHSSQEWVWRRADYEAMFAAAPPGTLRGESTPFYLWSPTARRRIAEELPHARLVVVVRDPVDRAYSNWMHLWSDGLEPDADFVSAFGREDERVAAGWAPFWRYRDLGLYGRQLRDLYDRVDPDRVLVLRYGDLVDEPDATLDRVARFLGITEGLVGEVPPDNARPFVAPGLRTSVLSRAVRTGAGLGALVPPKIWRTASRPLLSALHGDGTTPRPRLQPEQRARLVETYDADITLLEQLTDLDLEHWRRTTDRGSFAQRQAARAAREGAAVSAG